MAGCCNTFAACASLILELENMKNKKRAERSC